LRGWVPSLVSLLIALAASAPAPGAEVHILIDKSSQRMRVSVDGAERYSWPVSTGMANFATPDGAFTPNRLARTHFSREWDNAPMPHSIFFTEEGHAIHGSHAIGRLGTPASHGCVRLAPRNAGILFGLVAAEGLDRTRIEITGVEPIGIGSGSADGPQRDYSRLTSFDPLAVGIMAGGYEPRRRPRMNRPPLTEDGATPER
jgi:L,D-transpeptidase catalytic domain